MPSLFRTYIADRFGKCGKLTFYCLCRDTDCRRYLGTCCLRVFGNKLYYLLLAFG